LKRLLVVILLLLIIGAVVLALPARATSNSLWVNQDNLNVEVGESAPSVPEIAGQPCFQTIFKIKHFVSGGTKNGQTAWKEAPDQERKVCAVQSGVGLVANDSGGTYIQFPGSAHGIRIHSNMSNFNVTVIPVPGSKTVLVQTKTSSHPAATHIFYNLLGVGEVTISGGEAVYYLRHWPERFTDQSGGTLEMSNFAFSNDGEWVLAVVRSAVMRIHVKTKAMQAIARGSVDGGIQYRMSLTNDGRYAFVQSYHQGSSNPVIYDLQGCHANQQYNYGQVPTIVLGCSSRPIKTSLSQAVPGFLLLEQMRFGYDAQTLNGLVAYREATTGSVLRKRVNISNVGYVKPVLAYLALGDSFSSGEGDTEGSTWYEPGTDTGNNKCHLSRRSYSYLVAEQIGLHAGPNKSPATDGQFRSIACSGATSRDIVDTSKDYSSESQSKGKESSTFDSFIFEGFLPGYRAQLSFLDYYSPSTATISIIGNDVGFANKIRRCLEPDTCYGTYEDRLELLKEIESKFSTLTSLYNQLKDESPETKIYVVGYPQIVSNTGTCGANVRLNQEEREFAQGLVQYLNDTIEAATKHAGLIYVDAENTFSGRKLCDSLPQQFLAINGLTAGDDKGSILGNESYHPNPLGHTLLKEKVIQQTDALNMPMPAPDTTQKAPSPTSSDYATFLSSVPKTGRELHAANYDDNLTNDVVYRSKTWGALFSPVQALTNFRLWLNSEPVDLGTFTSDDEGNLHMSFTVPESVPTGFHTLHAYGKSITGDNMDIYKTVFIAASETDYDGDGISNSEDSCDMLPPTGIDEDKDSVDDACDDLISDPPIEPELPTNPPVAEETKPPENNPETVAGTELLPLVTQPSSHIVAQDSAPAQLTNPPTAATQDAAAQDPEQGVLASIANTTSKPESNNQANTPTQATSAALSPSPQPTRNWTAFAIMGAVITLPIIIFLYFKKPSLS
jgi:hypothetical protein